MDGVDDSLTMRRLSDLLKVTHDGRISTEQCMNQLDEVMELLPRHIAFVTFHSGHIINMHAFGVMCRHAYERFGHVIESHVFDLPSNESLIKCDKRIYEHLQTMRGILGAAATLPRGNWATLNAFLHHMAVQPSFSAEFKKNYSEISSDLSIRNNYYRERGAIMRCIGWYIAALRELIEKIETSEIDPLDPANAAIIDEYILVPGCNLFGISKRDPMTTLHELVSKAEELLQFDWTTRRQTLLSLIPATRRVSAPHLANKANKAKALLTSVPFTTSEERAKMLARSGIMTSLVSALVQPPHQMQPKELAQLKDMISRRDGGRRIKKTKRNKQSRRKTKSKSMKNN